MTLKEKYGNEMVLTIPAERIECSTPGPFYRDNDIDFCAKRDGVAKYRYEAEDDPSFKQLVVYAVITDNNWNTFTTHRLAGDSRLTGQYSVGTGGHVAPLESFTDALFRELKEEVGLEPDDIDFMNRIGYILDDSSPVNSVHLGVVYEIGVRDQSCVEVQEKEKLAGEWMTGNQLAVLAGDKKLESWSEIVLRYI